MKKNGIEDTAQAVFAFLIERVRNNLHLVLCMSPVGEPFRNRIRQYPAFVNCTTIDWFSEWPQDALLEVAERYLEGLFVVINFSFQLLTYLQFLNVHSMLNCFIYFEFFFVIVFCCLTSPFADRLEDWS